MTIEALATGKVGRARSRTPAGRGDGPEKSGEPALDGGDTVVCTPNGAGRPRQLTTIEMHGRWKRRNEDYGVCGDRTPKLRAKRLDHDKLAAVVSPYVRLSLELQAAFGLRAEESIKFTPSYADKGDHIALKASWCKGGRARTVPITHARQRELLDRVRKVTGSGALIEPGRNYIQQRWLYEHQAVAAGLKNNHGLRHAWAQWRYEQLSGMKAPAKSGKAPSAMTREEALRDRTARQALSYELGEVAPQFRTVR